MNSEIIATPDDRDTGMTLREIGEWADAAMGEGVDPDTAVKVVAGVRRRRLLKISVEGEAADDPAGFREAALLSADEVHPMLLSIWLDGFHSGGSSALASHTDAEPDESAAAAFALGKALRGDPLAILAVEDAIRERLKGINSGPRAFKITELDDGE